MKIKMSSYFLLGILAVALLLGIYSLTYGSIRMAGLPFVSCALVFVLSVIELRKDLIEGPEEVAGTTQAKDVARSDSGEVRKYFPSLYWMAGLVGVIYLMGFLIATPLFITGYLKREARSGWLMSIASAAITTLLIYGVFVYILQTDLFPGIVFGG